jgi:RNA polymerase sigma-70 factor, ECF subfamily
MPVRGAPNVQADRGGPSGAPAPLGFESVYSSFYPRIRRHLARLVGETDADDLAQEVFVRALGSLDDLRNVESLRAWLYRVATNAGLDRLRQRARARIVGQPIDEDGAPEEGRLPTAAIPATVESEMIRGEMSACVRAVVERLPVIQRFALTMSEIEGHSDAEIAALAGVSVGCVKIRLHRARARLREELGQRCRLSKDRRNRVACEPRESLRHVALQSVRQTYPFAPRDRLGE